MKLFFVGIIVCVLCIPFAQGQVLTTGETGGKDKSAVFASANRLFALGLTLHNGYAVLWYGFNNRLDGAMGIGAIEAERKTQAYALVASNLNLLKRSQVGADVSLFQATSTPINHGSGASTLLSNFALVVSRPLGPIVPYTGGNILISVGNHPKEGKLFTPPQPWWMIQLGVNVPISKKLSLYGEGDWGPDLKALGVGALLLM